MILTNKEYEDFNKRCCENEIDQYGDFIESVQGELVRAGSIFKPRYKIKELTFGEMNDIFTRNNLRLKFYEDKQ